VSISEKEARPAPENSHWEPLGKNCRVLVTEEHKFTTDTLLLACFSMPRGKEDCADIGTGCGTIPLLWCARGEPGFCMSVEVQREAAHLARLSIEENGFEGRMYVVLGNIREYKLLYTHQSLDLMACNPPYYPPDSGYQPKKRSRKISRHEDQLTLEVLAAAGKYCLKQGGRLCICLPTERLTEAMGLFQKYGLEPKRLQLVQSRPGKAPYLFLLECRRGGKPGLAVEPTLIITDEQGNYTREMQEIYGDYREKE